ncbi:60S ribosomal protein L7-4-like protein, partial [Tanacetum coccineum]
YTKEYQAKQKELIQLECEARLKLRFYVYPEAKMFFMIRIRGMSFTRRNHWTQANVGMYTDNSGTITVEELKHGLSKQGTRILEYEVKHLEAVRIMQISQENGQKPDKHEHENEKSAQEPEV